MKRPGVVLFVCAGIVAVWDGLEDRSLLWWLALPVILMAVFVEVNHRREANVLPVALAGHGLTDERKRALILELDTSPRYAAVRAETAQAAVDVFIGRWALGGAGCVPSPCSTTSPSTITVMCR